MSSKKIVLGMIVIIAVIMLAAASMNKISNPYKETNDDVCTENGKPVVSMYSTTTCPHCEWIGEVFDRVAKEYADRGLIVAHHWQFDEKDDLITEAIEGEIPVRELEKYDKYNPSHTVPTFVIGCKYYKVGNSFEMNGDLAAEEAYLREHIEKVL